MLVPDLTGGRSELSTPTLARKLTRALTPPPWARHRLLAAVLVIGTAGCFAFDAATPRGVGDGIGYPILLTLCLWLPDRRVIWGYALVASLLTVGAGFLSSDGGISVEGTALNRGFAVATIWLLAAILMQRRRLEERLKAAQDQATIAAQAKSSFLANMSHELRTPLNAIIGFSDLIRKEVMGPAGQTVYVDYAESIHESGTHLLAIINDVLDLSRIEAKKYRLDERPIAPADAVGEVLRIVDATAREAGLTIDVAAAPRLPLLVADRRAVQQMLLALVSNAIKYTPSGGRVRIDAGLGDDGLWFAVSDTGVGMSASNLRLLGQPFVQMENPTSKSKAGVGLGLMLCQQLADLHGARLTIDSTAGKGTTVRLTFPAGRVVFREQAAAL